MRTFIYIVICLVFIQNSVFAQTLNDFNDVRQMGVLLNPAHIGKADAKGELNVNYQLNTQAIYTHAEHLLSLAYVRHFKINTKHGLNLGITSDNQTTSYRYDATSAGVNLAYTFFINDKNAISVGQTTTFYASKRLYPHDIQCIENCPSGFGYNTTIGTAMNLGLTWKTALSPNANFSLALVGRNTNSPINYYTFYINDQVGATRAARTLPDYALIANADFMVSERVGFAPIFVLQTQPAQDNSHDYAMQVGTDVVYKINQKHTLQLGFTQQMLFQQPPYWAYDHPFSMFGLRYKTPRMTLGLSYNTVFKNVINTTIVGFPNFQLGVEYAFL